MSMQFWGACMLMSGGSSNPTLSSFDVNHFTLNPTTATAGVRLRSTGQQDSRQGGVYTQEHVWLQSGGVAGDYQVRATVNSGALSSGTTGTWLALSTTREWFVQSAGGFESATITLEIRLAVAPNTVFTDSSHTLQAEMGL
jgi:hypothetical protein